MVLYYVILYSATSSCINYNEPLVRNRSKHEHVCLMYRFYHHFNMIHFEYRLNINDFPLPMSSVFFVSSEFQKHAREKHA